MEEKKMTLKMLITILEVMKAKLHDAEDSLQFGRNRVKELERKQEQLESEGKSFEEVERRIEATKKQNAEQKSICVWYKEIVDAIEGREV